MLLFLLSSQTFRLLENLLPHFTLGSSPIYITLVPYWEQHCEVCFVLLLTTDYLLWLLHLQERMKATKHTLWYPTPTALPLCPFSFPSSLSQRHSTAHLKISHPPESATSQDLFSDIPACSLFPSILYPLIPLLVWSLHFLHYFSLWKFLHSISIERAITFFSWEKQLYCEWNDLMWVL